MVNNKSKPKDSQSAKSPSVPAPPTYQLLDDFPTMMARPLSLINGMGYAAAWVPVSKQITETLDEEGNIVLQNPPLEEIEETLVIVRSDGQIFGLGTRNQYLSPLPLG